MAQNHSTPSTISDTCPSTPDDTTSHHWVPRRAGQNSFGQRRNEMVCQHCGVTYAEYLDALGLR